MRQITTRERAFLSIGVLAGVGIFVYFILWPMLQGEQSGSMSGLEDMQERLESVEKLGSMQSLLVDLEKRLRSQSGYGEMSFKRGIADSVIISYLAETANQAGIKDIEQLDAKPDTKKQTQTEARSDQTILRSIVDQLYLCQVIDEVERLDEVETAEPEPRAADLSDDDAAEIENQKSEIKNSEVALGGSAEASQPAANSTSGMSSNEAKDFVSDETKDIEQAEPEGQATVNTLMFPLLPGSIPDEFKRSLAEWIESHQGQTIGTVDMEAIVEQVGIKDKEKENVKKQLKNYSDGIRETKSKVRLWLSILGVSQDAKTGQKIDRFSIKMVFKSGIDSLVKLLYNLQNSAKWLRVEGMRITISDRKQTLLSVELSMSATALYE
jgi:hypothetical protein